MNPFDQPPATPPAATPFGEPPVGPRRSGTRRVAIAAVAVGLAGVGVFGVSQLVSADRADDDASAMTIDPSEPGDEQGGPSSQDPSAAGTVFGGLEDLDGLQECLEQQFPEGPFGDDFDVDEFLQDFDVDEFLDDFDAETFDPESLDFDALLEELDIDQLLEDLDLEGLDLEGLDPESLDGFTIESVEPGESRVFGDGELFGTGGTSVTVVGPDGVTMYKIGDGDGSINIAQSDGDLVVTTEGDVTVLELADLFGGFDIEQFCPEAPAG
jgi:hypothetical protein